MYIIKHALLNLLRNKSRNILLGVIIFTIITAAVVTLAIFNTARIVIQETRDSNVIESVENLQSLMFAFLVIVLVLGAFIMVLLSVISIRERKYEIGVLRAMGMEKRKIALGLWVEIITITCICFVLGMGAGAMLSQPVSDTILVGQSDLPTTESTTLADRLNIPAETEEPIKVNVSVNASTAMGILGISILLASVAGVVSVGWISKYEPLRILRERD